MDRPSMQSVQRTLILGLLAGIIFGCILGSIFGMYYAWQVNPAVYVAGAYPAELTTNYQDHYVAMTVDSYIVNRQIDVTQERLKTFDQATKVRVLGERSAAFVANGQAAEAQLVNELATNLSQVEGWSPDVIATEVSNLTAQYQGDNARVQAINTYGSALGVVPAEGATQPTGEPTAAPPPEPTPGVVGLFTPLRLLFCCLVIIVIALIVYLLYRRMQSQKGPAKPQEVWEGEGPAPLKQWSGTYTLGHDNYDEFFTIETNEGDFLGESGMGILEALPGTTPKQVMAFDMGLFDKTDITTLSRVVMSPYAFNDETIRSKIEANPQAEAILAEPDKEFEFETSALRVAAKIDELEFDPEETYFNKLKVTMNVFLKEGADLKIGSMDVPEEYQ